MLSSRFLAVVVATLVPLNAWAQQRAITLDDLYDPQKRIDLGGPPAGITWLDNTRYLQARGGRGQEPGWLAVDALTGTTAPFLDTARLEAALASLAGVSAEDAKRLARRSNPMVDRPRPSTPTSGSDSAVSAFNPSRTAMMLRIGDDLYHYTFATGVIARLTTSQGDEDDPQFSPDGRFVAYTRGGNLFAVDVASQRERQLTTDGSAQILNGRLDWVYQEEIYGRGTYRAFWWSPDSTRLAFLRLDERPVPEFTLVDHIPHRAAPRGLRLPEGRRPESPRDARRRARRRRPGPGHRHLEVLGVQSTSSSTSRGRRRAPTSCSRCRIASRRGST